MQDYWNDPPDYPEPPDWYMTLEDALQMGPPEKVAAAVTKALEDWNREESMRWADAYPPDSHPMEHTNLIDLDYSLFVKTLAKPGDAIISGLTPLSAHLLHMAVGLSGEAAELTACLQEAAQDALQLKMDRLPVGSFDLTNLIEELGDNEWYIEGAWQGLLADGVEQVDRPEKSPGDSLGASFLVGHLLELNIRQGLFLDAAKRYAIYASPLNKDAAVAALINYECSLLMIYDIAGVTPELAKLQNKLKLSKRYEKLAYSDAAAHARADKKPGE